jgi:hypothetical protein
MNRKIMSTLVASVFALAIPMDAAVAAKKTVKKDKRAQMTEEQKKQARKSAREWCMKYHAKGNAYIERVEILSDGRVRCWIRG